MNKLIYIMPLLLSIIFNISIGYDIISIFILTLILGILFKIRKNKKLFIIILKSSFFLYISKYFLLQINDIWISYLLWILLNVFFQWLIWFNILYLTNRNTDINVL